MVTSDELGNQAMSIQSISVRATAASDTYGSYENFVLLMGHTSLSDLTATFDNNWATSGTGVFADANLEITGSSVDQWVEFVLDEPFAYDGSSNLLMEIVWDGPDPEPPTRGEGSIYTWCWIASSNRTVTSNFSSSSTGTPGTICQMLKVDYNDQALDQMTFAGIKGSF